MAPAKVEPDPTEIMKDCEGSRGMKDTHKMSDGWVIHSETWTPSGEPRAVLLHGHGWMESTVTIGMRRIAKQCLARNIILVAYDQHGHGESLEKNGIKMPEKRRGVLDSSGFAVLGDHMVAMSKFVLDKYKLPLMIMGHSLGADGACLGTRRIVEECKVAKVPFICALYLAIPTSYTPGCCCDPCIKCCACCCCGCPCCVCSQPFWKEFNPGHVLGEQDHLPSRIYLRSYCIDVCTTPAGGGPPDFMTLIPAIDAGVNARVFFGNKDHFFKKEFKTKLPTHIHLEVFDGVTHDFLSADPRSMECIGKLFEYIDEQLTGAGVAPTQTVMQE